VKAVGLDAIEIERIERSLERHGQRFLDRVYTAREQETGAHRRDRSAFLAGRFAAKEAVLKALGTGWSGGIGFTDVEVLRLASGAPQVTLHALALERARELGIEGFLISITHTRRDAHAVAIAL